MVRCTQDTVTTENSLSFILMLFSFDNSYTAPCNGAQITVKMSE